MLEEPCGKVAMKKMQVYGWHKRGNASINDNLHCGRPQVFDAEEMYT